ncbi:carbohydrate ABC transporter permease [Cohnella fermenti]|uniref:Carbohydrate ABC transporter permease n=1 Tax=Cohnella fermenti TaxID=2565925 RepID=A0A4S4CB93_9BACL|nr:carbohydrate ABC transporter permease [Cohnella fermenti]
MSDRLFVWIVYAILTISTLAVALPFLYVVMVSFSTKAEVLSRGFFLLPKTWSLDAYQYLFREKNFLLSFRNSLWITLVGTVVNIALTSMMAYGLSKPWIVGRRALNILVLFTMLFNGGIIPTYLVVNTFGLLNSYWAIWLTAAIAPFNLIVMRGFFQSFPPELEEASRIDGCSEFYLFRKIVLPLSTPAIATFTLFYLVQNWNTYFNALIYLNDSTKWPLQVFLRQMLIEAADSSMTLEIEGFEFGPPVKMATVVATALPLLLIYPFFQKHFNQGMMLGSVKG